MHLEPLETLLSIIHYPIRIDMFDEHPKLLLNFFFSKNIGNDNSK